MSATAKHPRKGTPVIFAVSVASITCLPAALDRGRPAGEEDRRPLHGAGHRFQRANLRYPEQRI